MARETILVVDDTADNRDFVMRYILEPNGYTGLTAENGKEGLKLALQYKPDLIILDYNMPVLDGPGMVRLMNERGLNIPVILMTFHGSEDIAVEMFRLGVRDYIAKPFDPEDMEALIDKHLAESRLRREKEALTNRVLDANRNLKSRVDELNLLYQVGKHVTALIDIQQLLVEIVEAAVKITHSNAGKIYILRDQTLICRADKKQGEEAQIANKTIDDKHAGQVVQTGKTVFVLNPFHAAYTPLIVAGKVIGVLHVERFKREQPYADNEENLLNALSDYAAIAITNSRNHDGRRKLTEQKGTGVLPLPPSKQTITVLVIGAKVHAQKAEPSPIIGLLNRVMAQAGQILQAHHGQINNVIGDTLVCYFDQPNHVLQAVEAALAIHQISADSVTLHSGIATGNVILGSIDGTPNHSILGDAVSLATRLREYAGRGQILTTMLVLKQIGERAQARRLGEMAHRGRKITVVELRGVRPPTS